MQVWQACTDNLKNKKANFKPKKKKAMLKGKPQIPNLPNSHTQKKTSSVSLIWSAQLLHHTK